MKPFPLSYPAHPVEPLPLASHCILTRSIPLHLTHLIALVYWLIISVCEVVCSIYTHLLQSQELCPYHLIAPAPGTVPGSQELSVNDYPLRD